MYENIRSVNKYHKYHNMKTYIKVKGKEGKVVPVL
jgi:hypothetical protein